MAINWAEFTAVEKRHTANIIHRTRPVIWCRFATENRIPRRDSRKISREPNEFPQFDSFSQKHLPKNSFVRVDFPTHRKEYRFLLDQNRAYFLMFVESKFYLERERNGKFVFGKFDGGRRISLLSTSVAITRTNLVRFLHVKCALFRRTRFSDAFPVE